MLLFALLAQPGVLLPVREDLQAEAAEEDGHAEGVRCCDCSKRGEGSCGKGIERDDGEEAEGYPGLCQWIDRAGEAGLERGRPYQVACATKAPKNLGAELRMLSKRESRPSSAVMRLNKYVPTVDLVSSRGHAFRRCRTYAA